MVKFYRSTYTHQHDFATFSVAYFLRYPKYVFGAIRLLTASPYATHVVSVDTLARSVDEQGRLHTQRLVVKKGKLPQWCRVLLSSSKLNISESLVLEKSVIDPRGRVIYAETQNVDYTKIMRVVESATYRGEVRDDGQEVVKAQTTVSFVSSFGFDSMKERMELWGQRKMGENLDRSRLGMGFVMDRLREQGGKIKLFQLAMQQALQQ